MPVKRLTKQETDRLLSVKVGPPTCLDAKDAARGIARDKAVTHVELRANLTPEQQRLLGRKRMSRNAFLPTGKRRYEAELREVTESFASEVSGLVMRAAVEEGLIGPRGAQPFGQRAAAYVEVLDATAKKGTRYDHELCLRYIEPIAGIPLEDVTVDDVERCLIEVRDSPRNARWASSEGDGKMNMAHKVKGFISGVFNDAISRGLVTFNPASARSLQRAFPKNGKPVDPYTEEEAEQLAKTILDMPKSAWWRTALWIQLATGMRPGEALGLQWQDVELDADPPTLYVRRMVSKYGLDEVKTPTSRRAITLDPLTVAMLRERKADMRAFAEKAGVKFTSRWFVSSSKGERHMSSAAQGLAWKKVVEEAGVRHRRMYSLRHTFATLVISKGLSDIKSLSRILGHANVRTTLNTYAAYIHENAMLVTTKVVSLLVKPAEDGADARARPK